MKVYFYAYGWRDVKNWSCSNCNNFYTCGADIAVDESIRNHQAVCPAVPTPSPSREDGIEEVAKLLESLFPDNKPGLFRHINMHRVIEEVRALKYPLVRD